MKLRRIELEQVRRFERPVVVDGIGDGLNVIAGANEAGKTTLLAALNAGLFLKHTSSRARELQHHRHRTAPRIALEVEIDGERLVLEKRFLQRRSALLVRSDGVRLEGDAAEHAFQAQLCGSGLPGAACPGLWNLLLVGQGRAIEHIVQDDARGVLQASLEAHLDDMTGGTSAKGMIVRIEDRLFGPKGLIRSDNRKSKGRFRDLESEMAALDRRCRELDLRRTMLQADFHRLETALRELAVSNTPDAAAEAELARLEELEATLIVDADAAAVAARSALALREAEDEETTRHALRTARDDAARRLEVLGSEVSAAAVERDRRLASGEALAAQAERQDRALAAAEAWLRATAEADRLRRALEAGAADVWFDLDGPAAGELRLNGAAPGARRFKVKVSERLAIEAPRIGRIEVRAAQAERLGPALREVEERRDAAHAALSQAGLEPRSADIERLRAESAELKSRLEDARTAFRDARAEVIRSVRERDAARAHLQDLEGQLERARAAVPDEVLAAAVTTARAAHERLAQRPVPVPVMSLEEVRHRLRERRQARDAGRHLRFQLEKEVAALTERVEALQGQGLKEEIDEALRKRVHLQHEHDALAREVEVLSLLRDTLSQAEHEVRESYTAPLVERLRPALDQLLPGARVELDEDLHIRAVIRPGAGAEDFALLSHGTQEQLAVLARLAFAELLIDAGQPCFVVLDDALVFSDDDRLSRMFRILERASQKVQILVLTCRERAFQGLAATRLRIEELAETALA